MTKAWDYMKSRGERERAKHKYGDKSTTKWDFKTSYRGETSVDPSGEQVRIRELISQGWVPVNSSSAVAVFGRQLRVDLVETIGQRMDMTWVPVWFSALYSTQFENRSVLGLIPPGMSTATEKLRNDRREQVLVVSEYLLSYPYGASDTRTAAIAFIDRFRAR